MSNVVSDEFSLMRTERSRKNPVLIVETETEMRVMLAEVARGLIDEPYKVRVFVGTGKAWELELITESGRTHQVQTQRGPTRTWLALDKALEAVETYCVDATRVRVEIGKLVLESVEK